MIGYISDDIIGGISIVTRHSIETIQQCEVDADHVSSNYNNHVYAVHLPCERTAIVTRREDRADPFVVGPQQFELVNMWDAEAQSAGLFVHPAIRTA